MARKPDQGIYWGLYLLLGSVGLGCLIMGIYALGMDNLKDYRITGLWGIGMIIGLSRCGICSAGDRRKPI